MKYWILFGIALVTFVYLLLARPSVRVNKPQEELTVAVFEVPEGQQEEIKNLMNSSFSRLKNGDGQIARVEVMPNGYLALIGPQSVQSGFQNLIDGLTSEPTVRDSSSNLTMNCWFVLAKTAPTPSTPAQMSSLSPVLSRLTQTEGVNRFHLMEKLTLTSSKAAQVSVLGRYFRMEQRLQAGPGHITAKVQCEGFHGIQNNLETEIQVEFDKFLVIGESSFHHSSQRLPELDAFASEPVTLYYILKAERPK